FPPDQRAGKSVGRLKPSTALSGSSKRRAQRWTLLAQQFLFRGGELFEFVFADLRIFQIKIGQGFHHRRCDHDAGKPFVVCRHHVPRRFFRRSFLNHFFVRFHVIVPEIALGGVVGRELPVFERVIDSLEESSFLFL